MLKHSRERATQTQGHELCPQAADHGSSDGPRQRGWPGGLGVWIFFKEQPTRFANGQAVGLKTSRRVGTGPWLSGPEQGNVHIGRPLAPTLDTDSYCCSHRCWRQSAPPLDAARPAGALCLSPELFWEVLWGWGGTEFKCF